MCVIPFVPIPCGEGLSQPCCPCFFHILGERNMVFIIYLEALMFKTPKDYTEAFEALYEVVTPLILFKHAMDLGSFDKVESALFLIICEEALNKKAINTLTNLYYNTDLIDESLELGITNVKLFSLIHRGYVKKDLIEFEIVEDMNPHYRDEYVRFMKFINCEHIEDLVNTYKDEALDKLAHIRAVIEGKC